LDTYSRAMRRRTNVRASRDAGGAARRRRHRHNEERLRAGALAPAAAETPDLDWPDVDIEDLIYAAWGHHAAECAASER
jgi:hypothetical protein